MIFRLSQEGMIDQGLHLAALLSRLGAGTDIPIGSSIGGRTDDALNDLVGSFVNTLVLRTDVSRDPSLRTLVGRARMVDLEAYSHQDLPFERLVEVINPKRLVGRNPLAQVMLTFDNTESPDIDLPGLKGNIERAGAGAARFDLSLYMAERKDSNGKPAGVFGYIEYKTDLFDADTVDAMAQWLATFLRAAIAEPDRPITAISIETMAKRD